MAVRVARIAPGESRALKARKAIPEDVPDDYRGALWEEEVLGGVLWVSEVSWPWAVDR
jgi:hypothetical protein